MTTLYEQTVKCAACGSENVFTVVGSTNTFGSPDLDTRPPEMRRSTMFAWVQRCPACGYCASDISSVDPEARALTRSEKYLGQLNNDKYPDLANSFLCKAMIDLEAKRFAEATWALINAAWVCDDNNCPEGANACRRMAADMLVQAEDAGQQVAEPVGAGKAILVDLLRRSGQMDRALGTIKSACASTSNEIILGGLAYQQKLVEKQDATCHTIEEALGDSMPRARGCAEDEKDDEIPF